MQGEFKEYENWRTSEIGFPRLLAYTTFSDRMLLLYMVVFVLVLVGFSVATVVLAQS